ncbi:MAG: hypothetical protein WCT10_00650 [Patescibacteria group bacterium]|jgi:hypothetical protein
MKKTTLFLLLGVFLLSGPAAVRAQDVRQGFDPNVLIQDRSFSDTRALGGAEGVQKFLESKNSILADVSLDFLARLNEPADPYLKFALGDPGWNLGRLRTAAELIWDASQTSGLNPQVILVTLNKEQGLVTAASCYERSQLQRALNHAMGFDCPDSSGCGNLFPGFYYQLFGNLDTSGNRYLGAAKSLMRSFATPGGRGPSINGVPARIGDRITLDNTLGDFLGIPTQQTVTIGNSATAALYRYTPHVFNGNYNFWNFFTSWFKYSNGTLLSSAADGLTYIIQDGLRQRVPNFVAASRQLDLAAAVKASPNELNDYPPGPAYGPADNTVIIADNKLFAFLDGVMHPVTSFVLAQRKLSAITPLPVAPEEAALFTPGSQLTPTDGTILRGLTDVNVYLVENGSLKKFSLFTFRQREAAKLMQKIADDEIALYPKQGYVAPLSGTLIKARSDSGLYVMSEGRRLPLTPELFKNLGFRQKDVVTLETIDEMASIPLGPPSTPRELTYFSIGDSPELFIFKNGAKHPIFPFVAKQRRITPDYRFEAGIVSGWPDGIAVPPRDNTLVKSAATTAIYTVKNGQLRRLTAELIKNLRLNPKQVVTLPDYEIAAFAKGGYAEPADNTYFQIAGTKEFYLFRKGAKHRIYPLVAAQRGMTPDFTFEAAVANDWPADLPVALREGTLVKSDAAATVYLVSAGKLRPLTDTAFKRRGYSLKKVKVLAQAELDAFPQGAPLAK